MILRGYQSKIVSMASDAMKRGSKRVLVCSPTGSGKTVIIADIFSTAVARRKRCWIVTHRSELVSQTSNILSSAGVAHGIVKSGVPYESNRSVYVCSVQSLIRRLDKLECPDMIVWDECHHICANSWSTISKRYDNAYQIGLTATAIRADGKGLREHFDSLVNGPSTKWLIDNGYLSRYKLFAPSSIDTSGLKTRMGDWVKGELAAASDRPSITGNAIDEYSKRCRGKRAIVFCVGVAHSKNVCSEFISRGILAAHVDGTTPEEERNRTMDRFRSGELMVICNCDLFGEGLDVPGIECVILLRPTQSLGLYMQQVGRSLRTADGKDFAIILDHAGNASRHGLPDEERKWTLDGAVVRHKKNTVQSCRICQYCYGANRSGSTVCAYCDREFPVDDREVREVSGSGLVEIDIEAERKRAKEERYSAKSIVELTELGRRRGYRNPYYWALKVFNGRNRK